MNAAWEWVPNSSLGPIKLGDKITEYIKMLNLLVDTEEGDATNWVGYNVHDLDIYIYVENYIIVSITSYDNFFYREKNIIGMAANKLGAILGCEPSELGRSVLFDDGDIQIPFEYFDLGLQLWVSNETVKSASILNVNINDPGGP